MNKIVSFLKKRELYYGITRYLLGLVMLPYSISKIMMTQFVIIPFSNYRLPLEELSGVNLTWAFLGYSPWFQVLLGLLEVIPALLLLFRKTSLLGGVLIFPMTLGVFLINHALDLWSYTQQLASILLILNCIIFIFEWQKLKSILLSVTARATKLKYFLPELAINVLLIILVCFGITKELYSYRTDRNILSGDWFHKHINEWVLTSEKANDSVVQNREIKLYFGPLGSYYETNDRVKRDGGAADYSINESEHLVSVHCSDLNEAGNYCLLGDFQYTILNDSMLQLRETATDSNKHTHTWTFRKRVMNTGKPY